MKKTFKRSLSMLLAIAIIFSSAYVGLGEVDFSGIKFINPFAVKADAASTSDLTFTLNSDGNSYSVTDCNSSASGSLIIPSTYNGKPVTSIGDYAFEYCRSLTSIEIPDSVTSIGWEAFCNCTSLTSIEIPNSVTSIGLAAFEYCRSLTSIEIPDSVTSIGDAAFSDCRSLTSIEIPDSVTSIGFAAFSDCTSLTSIEIPDSVTSIGDNAFCSCLKLASIEIPESVTSIGDYAFDCTSLKDVYYGGSQSDWANISIGSNNSYLTNATIHYNKHTYSSDWIVDVEPTCTEAGSRHNTCSTCGEVVTEVVPATGHSCDNWVVDSEATCTQDGSKHGVCSTCENEITETIPATGHQNTEWITEQEPNCTEAGYKDEWCLDCGEVVNTEEIPATGHQTTEWITEQEPNCTEPGYKDEWCLDCGEIINTEELPATGHQTTEWITEQEPNCTEAGYKDEWCLDCGELINTEEIPELGHSYGDWIIDVEPTCTEDGSKHQICSVCGDVKTEIILSEGHSFSTEWTIDVAPTCTEDGSKSHHCIDCDNAKADVTVIAPLGHNFIFVSVADEHPHIILSECSRCPETMEEESYSEKCGVCNFTYTDNTDGTCKITAYTGNSTSFVIPATINGKSVATTNTGAFKNNTTLTSVKIENGVQGIGSLAFLGCSSLSKVVIPDSVTSIGTKAFYNCSNNFTIYCYSGSYAMQYAIDNSLNYEIINIAETDNCTIDYDNKVIFANNTFTTSLDEIADLSSNAEVSVQGSFVSGSVEIFGTGSIVTITDGDSSFEYTLVINGDLNGDATCDVLDAAAAHLYSVGLDEPNENEILAANGCVSEELDANSYQNVVNMCLAS